MISALKAEEASQMQLVEREEMDEDDDLFEAIDKLIDQGINTGDVKKLQEAGIHTCNGLMMHTKKKLTGIKGLSEAKVDKICEAAEKIVNYGYITGSDVIRSSNHASNSASQVNRLARDLVKGAVIRE